MSEQKSSPKDVQKQTTTALDNKTVTKPQTQIKNQQTSYLSKVYQNVKVPVFNRQLLLKQKLQHYHQQWITLGDKSAMKITQFKHNYILWIGDIPIRTVVMGISTGATYLMCQRWSHTFIGKSRNFALCFLINGLFWVPQMFNPFLLCSPKE